VSSNRKGLYPSICTGSWGSVVSPLAGTKSEPLLKTGFWCFLTSNDAAFWQQIFYLCHFCYTYKLLNASQFKIAIRPRILQTASKLAVGYTLLAAVVDCDHRPASLPVPVPKLATPRTVQQRRLVTERSTGIWNGLPKGLTCTDVVEKAEP